MKPKKTKAALIWGSPALNFDSSNGAIFGLRHFNHSLGAECLLHPGNFFRGRSFAGPNDAYALCFQHLKGLNK